MIKNLLKGMVMGMANIIPGVSGGTMAVSMGIYDKLIHCITHLFKEFKKSVLFLLPVALGMGIALVGLSFIIEPAFEYFPLQTNCLFIGLIVGGLPAVFGKVKGSKIKPGHIVALVVLFVVVVGLAAIGEGDGRQADLSFSLISVLKLFVVGIIASATMVIPGVSGSMMLMLMGYYEPIIKTINSFIKSLVAFDMQGILQGCGVLVPMGIGIVIGIFAIAKLVEIIFEKFPLYAYWAIIGLIVASPIAILLLNLGSGIVITIWSVIVSIICFGAGFVVAMKLGE